MSWLVNISEKLSDIGNQISSNQSSNNENIGSDFSLIVALRKEIEILKLDKLELEKSIVELDQQHEEYLKKILKSKDDLFLENKFLQQTILNLEKNNDNFNGDRKEMNDKPSEIVDKNYINNLEDMHELSNVQNNICKKSDISDDCDSIVQFNNSLVMQYNILKDSNIDLKEELIQLSKKHSQIENTQDEIINLKKEIESLKKYNFELIEISKKNENIEKFDEILKHNEELKLQIYILDQANKELIDFKNNSNSKLEHLNILETSLLELKSENHLLKDNLLNITNTNKSLSMESKQLHLKSLDQETATIYFEKNLNDLNDEIKLLNNTNIEKLNLIEELKIKNEIIENKMIDLENNRLKMIKEFEVLETFKTELVKENESFQIFITNFKEKEKDYLSKYEELSNINSVVIKENELMQKQIIDLQKNVENLNLQILQMQIINDDFINDKNNLQNLNEDLNKEMNCLRKSILESNDNDEKNMIASLNGSAAGKTDSEKVLENKVKELSTNLKILQDKYNKLDSDNNKLPQIDTNLEKLSCQETNTDYLKVISDENFSLKKYIDEVVEQKNSLEANLFSVNNHHELQLKNVNIEFEQRYSDLQNKMSIALIDLEKLKLEKRQFENRISHLTDDYTSVLEKLSKNNLENKDIVAKTFTINQLILKLFDKLNIQRQDIKENLLQDNLLSNAEILVGFIEKNFDDLDKFKSLESERDNLRYLLQKTTSESNLLNEKLEETSKQLFVLQQKLSCSRSDILMATEQHKKLLVEIQCKHEADKQGLQTALNDISTKNMELQTQLDLYSAEYNEKFTNTLEEKNMLQQKLNELVANYEKISEENCILNTKVKDLSNEITMIYDLDKYHSASENNTVSELNIKLEKVMKENSRLTKHLTEMEESHNKEIIELSSKEIQLLNQIKDLETQLFIYTDKAKNNDLNNSQMYSKLDADLKTALNDLQLSQNKCNDQEKLINEYIISTSNLQLVLEEFHKNSSTIEIVELEKTRKLLISEKADKDDLIQKCSKLESELKNLKINENNNLKALNEFKSQHNEFLMLKETILIKDELISSLEKRLASIKTDTESKIEKIVIKNLILGYLHAPNTKKVEVLNVVGHILDFSDEDFKMLNCKNSSRWLDHVMFSTDSLSKNQSFIELFVKFLEKESTPPRFVSMSSTLNQSHLDVLNRSNSNQSQQSVMNSGKTELSNASLSRYLATLQQQRSLNFDQSNTNDNSVQNVIE